MQKSTITLGPNDICEMEGGRWGRLGFGLNAEEDGREWCLVVVRGFAVRSSGSLGSLGGLGSVEV